MQELSVQVRQEEAATIITLVGLGGMLEGDHLSRELTRVVAAHPKLAILDLSGVELLASLTMGSFVEFKRNLALRGGVVRIAGGSERVVDSLKRSRMDLVIGMYPTLEAAMAAE